MNLPTRSEQINELATALSKAQSQMGVAKRTSANPFFKSSYAGLDAVWDAIQKPLTSNGLAVSQIVWRNEDRLMVTTELLHSSGQWLRGDVGVRIPLQKNKEGVEFEDPQKLGSLITYLRRYSLAAIVGLAVEGEDDDAEGAMQRNGHSKPPERHQDQRTDKPKPSVKGGTTPMTEKQRGKLWAMCKDAAGTLQLTDEQIKEFLREQLNHYETAINDKGEPMLSIKGVSELFGNFGNTIAKWAESLPGAGTDTPGGE
jgi:hypothetical protein